MVPNRVEAMPKPALLVGLAGLVPIVGLAVQVATDQPLGAAATPRAVAGLLWCGALTLSFLGGVQWGLATFSSDRSDAWRRFGFAVLPPLLAWFALWVDGRNGLVALTVGLAVWLVYELWATGLGEAPRWHAQLRTALTIIAVLALVAAERWGRF